VKKKSTLLSIIALVCFTNHTIFAQSKIDPGTLLFKTNVYNFLFSGFSIASEYQYQNKNGLELSYTQQTADNYLLREDNSRNFKRHTLHFGYRTFIPFKKTATRLLVGIGLLAQQENKNCFLYSCMNKMYGLKLDGGLQYKHPKSMFVFETGLAYNQFIITNYQHSIPFSQHLQMHLSVGLYIDKLN
jgi:intracellular septation protein A